MIVFFLFQKYFYLKCYFPMFFFYAWIPETPSFAQKVREVESFEFRKCSWNFLGSLLTLQEVGFSTTLVISCLRAAQWPLGSSLTVGLVQR